MADTVKKEGPEMTTLKNAMGQGTKQPPGYFHVGDEEDGEEDGEQLHDEEQEQRSRTRESTHSLPGANSQGLPLKDFLDWLMERYKDEDTDVLWEYLNEELWSYGHEEYQKLPDTCERETV